MGEDMETRLAALEASLAEQASVNAQILAEANHICETLRRVFNLPEETDG